MKELTISDMSFYDKLKLLVEVSRPISWIILPLVFVFGVLMSGAKFTFLTLLQIALLSFPYNLILYGINDVYDYESDKRNPRKNSIWGLILNPTYASLIVNSSIVSAVAIFLSSLLTLNLLNIIVMFTALFLAYAYSAPPLRLKTKPPFDSITNGAYFIVPFLLGVSFGRFPSTFLVQMIWVTVSVMGLHAFSTIMDYSADKKAGDVTFAVKFGKRTAAAVFFVVSFCALLFGGFGFFMLNYFLLFCTSLALIEFFFPSEKLAVLFFEFIFIAFFITATFSLVQFFP